MVCLLIGVLMHVDICSRQGNISSISNHKLKHAMKKLVMYKLSRTFGTYKKICAFNNVAVKQMLQWTKCMYDRSRSERQTQILVDEKV